MSFTIHTIEDKSGAKKYTSPRRLFLTIDRADIVTADNPGAAILLVGEGGVVSERDAVVAGLPQEKLEKFRQLMGIEEVVADLEDGDDKAKPKGKAPKVEKVVAVGANSTPPESAPEALGDLAAPAPGKGGKKAATKPTATKAKAAAAKPKGKAAKK